MMPEDCFGRRGETTRRISSERANERMRAWFEATPIYLASSSAARREGLVNTGFSEKNVNVVEVPDAAEAEVFRLSKADSLLMDACARAKAEVSDSVPRDAFLFAFDTLVAIYPEGIDPAHPELLGTNVGETLRKPATPEAAKSAAKRAFLTVMLNRLRFADFERRNENVDTEMFGKARIAATGIHAITGMQVRFPYTEAIETYRDRIVALPGRLYSLVDEAILEEGVGLSFSGVEAIESLYLPDGRRIGEAVEGIVEDIICLMEESGVDPTRICGGIAYSLESVRKYLGIEEFPDLFQDCDKSDVPDRSIYSGYPERLVGNVLKRRAGELP